MAVQAAVFTATFPLVFTSESRPTLWSCKEMSRRRGPRSRNSRRSSFVSKGRERARHHNAVSSCLTESHSLHWINVLFDSCTHLSSHVFFIVKVEWRQKVEGVFRSSKTWAILTYPACFLLEFGCLLCVGHSPLHKTHRLVHVALNPVYHASLQTRKQWFVVMKLSWWRFFIC